MQLKFGLGLLALGASSVLADLSVDSGKGLSLTVKGQSGKFTVTGESGKKIDVEFVSLHEVTEEGTKTKNANNVNAFATTDFTFGELTDATKNGVDCKTVSFSSLLSGGATLKVDTYLFLEGGEIINPGPNLTNETYPVTVGSMKFDVGITNFAFCSADNTSTNCNGDIGAALDLQVNIKGAKDATKSDKDKTFDLGGDMSIDVSDIITVDDVLVNMPEGFPSIETKGGKSVMTFRFPVFANRVTYDPVLQGLGGTSDPGLAAASSQPFMFFSLLVAFAALFR